MELATEQLIVVYVYSHLMSRRRHSNQSPRLRECLTGGKENVVVQAKRYGNACDKRDHLVGDPMKVPEASAAAI